MAVLEYIFSRIMNVCYSLCKNYGLAIILFTFASKIMLLPISIWVQKNSIKMVKIQPEINYLKIRYFGDPDAIAEEQSKIFKREKYNPLVPVIPLIFQIILLVGMIAAIKGGMQDPSINMIFLGIDLSKVPANEKGLFVLSPILAGFSAYLLCAASNSANVLQAEQSKANKYGMMLISVGLSVYLGGAVAVGVALYWIFSNIFTIIQLYLLNWMINPRKYVDYEQLEKSKAELSALESIGTEKRRRLGSAEARREKEDYKKFFSVINKHLVFYSEGNGFYKYYQGIIEYLLENTNIVIHYITGDLHDQVFELSKQWDNFRIYYIGEKKLITLMMKMDADIVVMTMPDLENFHIKKSYIRKDVEYVYVPHGMDSLNLTMRKGSVDHFDTVFCTGKHQKEEIEKTEAAYNLPRKNLLEWGYCLLDTMRSAYVEREVSVDNRKKILIAPSWQKDNIVDNCLDELLQRLHGLGYQIIVRPHPQHVRHQPDRMEQLIKQFSHYEDIEIQTSFSSNETVFEADLLITDWSGIAWEYAYTTCNPVLFIDTPMKIVNPEYNRIDVVPINIWMRQELGKIIQLDEIYKIEEIVRGMFESADMWHDKIDRIVNEYVYNLGDSAQVGAKYLVNTVQRKIEERKKEQFGGERK